MKAKKLFAGILAAAMILGSAVSGFAAPSGGTEPVPAPPTPIPVTPAITPVTPVYPVYPVYPATPAAPTYHYVPARPARPAAAATSSSSTATTAKALYVTESKIAETAAYKTLKETKPEITDIIDKVNAGEMDLATLAATFTAPEQAELVAKLAGKEFVSPFFDLRWNDGVTQAEKDTLKNAEGKYVVSLKIPALTPTLTGVQMLHYSVDRGEWEVEDTTALDLNAKTLSVGFKDFSPVAVIADADSLGE